MHLRRAAPIWALVEFSRSEPQHEERYSSVLAEAQVGIGIHQPYLRIEHTTRPEHPRDGGPGSPGTPAHGH